MPAVSKLVAIALFASLLTMATPAKADYPYCEVVVIESDGSVGIYKTCLEPLPVPREIRDIVDFVRDKIPL